MTDSNSQNNSPANNPLAQFLTPEAMLTPGVAGSLTMMITNALTLNFAMPRAWVGLGLSFIFGLLVLVTTRSKASGRNGPAIRQRNKSRIIFPIRINSASGNAGATVQVIKDRTRKISS